MRTQSIFAILILLVFAISSCNQSGNSSVKETTENLKSEEPENEESIAEMPEYIKEFKVKPEIYNVSGNKSEKIETKSGTEISIPANVFVDENGNKIQGSVEVSYKEIRSVAEIMIEEVDMKYDSAGVAFDFQTAGMFELLASSGGKPVFIEKGKSIEVSYTSNKEGAYSCYNYEGDNWKYTSEPKIISNENKNKSTVKSGEVLKPIKANPGFDLILDIKLDYSAIAELKPYRNITWKYAGTGDKSEVMKMLGSGISSAKVLSADEQGKYILTFKSGKAEKELTISPVFSPRAYDEAVKVYEQKKPQNSNFVMTSNLKRQTKVSELGLVNYDRIYHRSDAVKTIASFKIMNNGEKLPLGQARIFHITGDDDIVVSQSNMNQMFYTKKMTNKLVAILPGRKVAVLNTAGFLTQVSKNSDKANQVFELKVIDNEIKNSSDLDAIIAAL